MNKILKTLGLGAAVLIVAAGCSQKSETDRKVDRLLAQMTLQEKIGQMNQLPVFFDLHKAVKEQCLGSILCGVDEDISQYMHEAVEETRLGIPLLVGIDAIHGHSMEYNATMFPTQLALSCSWDEALCTAVARATAREMSGTGCAWTFSPVLCMDFCPRAPRYFAVGTESGEVDLFDLMAVRVGEKG